MIAPRGASVLGVLIRRRAVPRCAWLGAVATLAAAAPAQGATLRVSTSGSDSNNCTASAPCASFQRAYAVASNGAVVEVAGGSYGGQNFNAAPTTSPTTTPRSAPTPRTTG